MIETDEKRVRRLCAELGALPVQECAETLDLLGTLWQLRFSAEYLGAPAITSVPNYNVIELWRAPRSVRLALRSSAVDLMQWSGVEGVDTARYEAAFALARQQFEGIKQRWQDWPLVARQEAPYRIRVAHLRVTPAMEAGVSDHVWSLEEIAKLAD